MSIGPDDDEEFAEGKLLTRLHKGRERNKNAVMKKKTKVLEETGRLACEVCGSDFVEEYGELGVGIADCHHTVPIGELSEVRMTRLEDLAIFCPNCHRVIHSTNPMPTLEQLKELLTSIDISSAIHLARSYRGCWARLTALAYELEGIMRCCFRRWDGLA